MKRIILLLALAITLSSCVKNSLLTKSKGEFKIEFLFEQDGIKVYRFYDDGRLHYFTSKGETMTSQSESKTTYEENIN